MVGKLMKKNITLLSIAMLLLIITGCEKKEQPKQKVRSYEYFRAHTQEMLTRFEECEKIDYIMSKVESRECKSVADAKYVYDLENRK